MHSLDNNLDISNQDKFVLYHHHHRVLLQINDQSLESFFKINKLKININFEIIPCASVCEDSALGLILPRK